MKLGAVPCLIELGDDTYSRSATGYFCVNSAWQCAQAAQGASHGSPVRERLARTVALVREALPADMADPLLRQMQAIWL